MSTPGDVARRVDDVVTVALALACADRKVSEPGGVAAVNAGQRDVIAAAKRLTATVADLQPGDMPREWRERKSA